MRVLYVKLCNNNNLNKEFLDIREIYRYKYRQYVYIFVQRIICSPTPFPLLKTSLYTCTI